MRLAAKLAWFCAFCYMLVVWTTSLDQSWKSSHAKTYGDLLAAMAVPSPVGEYGAEIAERYYKLPQTQESLNAAWKYVPEAGPRRTAILVIMAVRTKGATCGKLLEWAPKRADVRDMCGGGDV